MAPNVKENAPNVQEDGLEGLKAAGLRKILTDLGEPVSGTKAELVERIRRFHDPADPPPADQGTETAQRPPPPADRAVVLNALAAKRCRNCATTGLFGVYSTRRRVRYVRCKACGFCDKMVI